MQLKLPCSASGNPPPSILWRKDRLTVVETLRISILPSGTLILNNFHPTEDSGVYECSAFNDHGFITSDRIVIDRGRMSIQSSVRRGDGGVTNNDDDNDIITNAFKQAKYEVESAENETVRILFDTSKNGE